MKMFNYYTLYVPLCLYRLVLEEDGDREKIILLTVNSTEISQKHA